MFEKGIDVSVYKTERRPKRELVKRALWACFQFFFSKHSPRSFSRIRVKLLCLFGATIGKRCYIRPGVKIWIPWNLTLGDYVVLGDSIEIYNLAPVKIGDNSVISQYTYICTASHDYTKRDFHLFSKPITIGSSVWIASGVFIAPGITIPDGTVIGARSVVTKNMPNWTICAGNPCHPIKPRYEKDDQVE